MTPPGRLTLDLSALAENWRRLARLAAPAECAAVIKADAYGLGVEIAAPALAAAGARTFFVAQAQEGARARQALGPGPRIFVLNGLEPGASDYLGAGLIPVLGSFEELQRWNGAGPFAAHFDTGMNRLGFSPGAEVTGPALVMSHLVSAETPDDPLNARQIQAFGEIARRYPSVPASLANSSGVFLGARYDLVRPGYALYGGNPTPSQANPMACVVKLEVVVQQVRGIEPGETAGYNARWTARRRTRLAVLLAGYADGLPLGAGATDARAGASVWIAGRMCPLVGRVSMDLTLSDVTDVSVTAGEFAQVIGPNAPLDAFAAASGALGYNVLTGLGRRYRREVG